MVHLQTTLSVVCTVWRTSQDEFYGKPGDLQLSSVAGRVTSIIQANVLSNETQITLELF